MTFSEHEPHFLFILSPLTSILEKTKKKIFAFDHCHNSIGITDYTSFICIWSIVMQVMQIRPVSHELWLPYFPLPHIQIAMILS